MKALTFLTVLAVMSVCQVGVTLATEPLIQVSVPSYEALTSHQTMEDNRLLVSVHDLNDNPIHGLTVEDFVVREQGKKAKIISVESLQTSEEVGLNIVFVVDNSASMKQRKAIGQLLSAFEAFFNTVRPIDNIHMILFAEKPTVRVQGHPLRVKTFSSNDPSELSGFLRDHFTEDLTDKTVLYEALLAGVEIARGMAVDAHKFLAVFSDGEDINSRVEGSVVHSYAQEIPNFEAYCIDYMPGPDVDPFLKRFAEGHGGRTWKATSATQLLDIFESFSTSLLHRYVVSYEILAPPRGTVGLEPSEINLDILTLTDGSLVGDFLFFEHGVSQLPEKYVLFSDREDTASFRKETLTAAMDRYLNALNLIGASLKEDPSVHVRIVGCNADTGMEEDNVELSTQRAQTVRHYLETVWQIEPHRMTVEGRNLPARPTPGEVLGGRAENQRVEIFYDLEEMQRNAPGKYIGEKNRITAITVEPRIVAEYGVSQWQIDLLKGDRVIHQIKGDGELEASYAVSLADLDKAQLAGADRLDCRIKVTDIHGDTFETTAPPCLIKTSKTEVVHAFVPPPDGIVAVQPDSVTIEEITTIDSSPLLNYVFFDTGQSIIPDRYFRLSDQSETKTFAPDRLRGTMEKYHHLLNIIGQRLQSDGSATVSLVGCTSDYGPEKGDKLLARLRAEAVKSYLQYVWRIDPARMTVSAQGLPSAPSTNRIPEGRAENQRVEILSEGYDILDTVESQYMENRIDSKAIDVLPKIGSGYGLATWEIGLFGAGERLDRIMGRTGLNKVHSFNLYALGLGKISTYDHLLVQVAVEDRKGKGFTTQSRCTVNFVEKEERIAQKMGYTVLEKYALILFDFDSAGIKNRNKELVERITERIQNLPSAEVQVVGHTDNIGKEDYNLKLSIRRAKAVYDQFTTSGAIDVKRISYHGVGPQKPLYDNDSPEGRALNRTVTVHLEYEDEG